MTAKSASRLKKLEKALSAQFDAVVKSYYDWKNLNETEAEIIADFRFSLPQTDDPELRALIIDALTGRDEPLEIQPRDEQILLAQWERVPGPLKEKLRRVGIVWID